MFDQLPTPTLLLDIDRMDANLRWMQEGCDRHGVELRPHIKTHKMVEVAKRQLAAGAAGLVCAKLSEAQALLPSGPRSLFIANSLADPRQAPRLRALAEGVEELIVACTSVEHAEALEGVLAAAELSLPVMMAIDTGLGREGARDLAGAVNLAQCIARQPRMRLHGLYTHEGHAYSVPAAALDGAIRVIHARLLEARDKVASVASGPVRLWPGCSVSAYRMAALHDVDAVRPGSYIFSDLSLTHTTQVMPWEAAAVTILTTVVDKPERGLALIDAGSKVFSSDKTAAGLAGLDSDRRDLQVVRCNEEHGYLKGADVDALKIGDRLRIVPAHICTVINLADSVEVVRGEELLDRWRVDARGCVT